MCVSQLLEVGHCSLNKNLNLTQNSNFEDVYLNPDKETSQNLTVVGQCDGYRLTPKLLWPIFCSFLKFGQPILVGVLMLNF